LEEKFVVRSEEDAWSVLQRFVSNQALESVVFENWPHLDIDVFGGKFNSSLNSAQMAAFVELRLTMARGFASIAHGAYDARKLKDYEDSAMEFDTHVEKVHP
jgi:hypothetical protein